MTIFFAFVAGFLCGAFVFWKYDRDDQTSQPTPDRKETR